jgi:hypothetical protein
MSTDHKLVLEDLETELPNVTFEYQPEQNAIKVNLQRYWQLLRQKIPQEIGFVRERTRNYSLFKKLESDLIARDPSKRGEYIVVNNPESRFLCVTEGIALETATGSASFVGRIGRGEVEEEIL